MDNFSFAISVLIMMLAVQFHQNWLVFGIAALMIVSQRDGVTTVLMVLAAGTLYVLQENIQAYWPFILVGLVLLSFILGGFSGGKQPELYPADPYAGLLGGGEQPGMPM